MVSPQVADGGKASNMEERLPIWGIAANILNKQSRTAKKEHEIWYVEC